MHVLLVGVLPEHEFTSMLCIIVATLPSFSHVLIVAAHLGFFRKVINLQCRHVLLGIGQQLPCCPAWLEFSFIDLYKV